MPEENLNSDKKSESEKGRALPMKLGGSWRCKNLKSGPDAY